MADTERIENLIAEAAKEAVRQQADVSQDGGQREAAEHFDLAAQGRKERLAQISREKERLDVEEARTREELVEDLWLEAGALYEAGVDITTIAAWLGHSQLTTAHGYVEINMRMKQKTTVAQRRRGRRAVRGPAGCLSEPRPGAE